MSIDPIEAVEARFRTLTDDEHEALKQLAAAHARIAELEAAMKAIKIRICYVGHPKERIVSGRPDWSDEIALIESAMGSSPDSVPAD